MKYYYGLRSAYEAGARQHPQVEIYRIAVDARDFRLESLGDCWFFEATEIADPPVYVLPCGPDGIPIWDYHNAPESCPGCCELTCVCDE